MTPVRRPVPEVHLDAFTQVPAEFWRPVTAKVLHNMMTQCSGRLTLPEREYLWRLLDHSGEPPRCVRVVFPPGSVAAGAETLLERLRNGP